MAPDSVWGTTDIGVAAYLLMNGLRVLSARRLAGGAFRFEFLDPGMVAEDLQIEYVNSEARRFDEAVRAMKKLCQDRGRGGR